MKCATSVQPLKELHCISKILILKGKLACPCGFEPQTYALEEFVGVKNPNKFNSL